MSLLCESLIGRRAELEVLTGRLGAPRGGAVFLVGEAGVGKTRLIREMVEEARSRGRVVLTGRSVRNRQATPYQPLTEALLAAFRQTGVPDDAELAPYRPALGRLIPQWHRPEGASAESAVVLGEGVLRMVDVLGGGARVLLVLEDLQWADPGSLTVLEYLVDHAGDGLLDCVATARPDPSPGLNLVRDLQARRAATVLEIPPLPDPEVASMALECLGGPTLPAGVNDILARADGLPLLVEELLSAAVDANGLIRRRDEWIVRSIASSVVPRSLADTVELRVRALDEADRDVPGAAAVLGRRFDLPLLRSMTGLSARDLRIVLDRCIELQLMTVDTEGYQFRHALTRNAVLAGPAPDVRTAMAGAARAVLARGSSRIARPVV